MNTDNTDPAGMCGYEYKAHQDFIRELNACIEVESEHMMFHRLKTLEQQHADHSRKYLRGQTRLGHVHAKFAQDCEAFGITLERGFKPAIKEIKGHIEYLQHNCDERYATLDDDESKNFKKGMPYAHDEHMEGEEPNVYHGTYSEE